MAKHRKPLRKVTAASVFLALLVAGSVAYAIWTTNGSGAGYARATTAQALTTVDVSATTVGDLYPGGQGDVILEISNPNPYDVLVTSIAGSGAITSNAGAACNGSTGVTFADQTGLTITVTAGDTTPVTLTDAASMDNTSDNACQGAIFTIPVALTGGSV